MTEEDEVRAAADALFEQMMKGDPTCSIQIEERVRKKAGEDGDIHSLTTVGTVKGNIKHEPLGEAYLVHFDNDEVEGTRALTFIAGEKIEKV